MATRKPTEQLDVVFVNDVRPVDRRTARAAGVPEARLQALRTLNSFSELRALPVANVWLPVDLDNRWRVAYRLAVQGGAVVVAEVRVLPREDGWSHDPNEQRADYLGSSAPVPLGGITTRLLRRVRLGAHHRVADDVLRRLVGDPFPLAQDASAQHHLDTLNTTALQQGRPRRPDLFFAEVAARYVAACARGSGRPALDVAREMREDAGLVRQWLYAARARKLLTRTGGFERTGQQGVKGGSLTPRARALLAGSSAKGKEVSPATAGRRATRKRKPRSQRRKR